MAPKDDAAADILHRQLFDRTDIQLYAVLDGCRIQDLANRLRSAAAEFACLFADLSDPILASAAPYIVAMPAQAPFTSTILREGWNRQWGIVLAVATDADLDMLRQHLRRNLLVKRNGGRPLLFRFYDPRAFKAVVPHLNDDERQTFFGPVQAFFIEGPTPRTALLFEPGGRPDGRLLRLTQ